MRVDRICHNCNFDCSLAAEFTKGEVKKIDLKQKKLTINHEALKSLDMPAMTMVVCCQRQCSPCQGKTKATEFRREGQRQAHGNSD